MKALLMSAILILMNKQLAEPSSVVSIFRYLVFFTAFAKVFYTLKGRFFVKRIVFFYPLLLFLGYCVIGAILSQSFVVLSLLKICSFGLGSYLFLVIGTQIPLDKIEVSSWFIASMVFSVFGSLLMYVFGQGYYADESFRNYTGLMLFCGVFNQSQVLGIASVLHIVVCIYLLFCTSFPFRRLIFSLMFGALVLLFFSNSRTALATLVVSLAMFVSYLSFYGDKKIWRHVSKNSDGFKMMAFLGGVFLVGYEILNWGEGNISRVRKLLFKTNIDGSFFDDLSFQGRVGIVQESFTTFLENPVYGIGFGTSNTVEFKESATWISAPYEKSFIFTAILEETGIIGFIFFMIFLWMLFKHFHVRRSYLALMILLSVLLINIGEANLLSFGGAGLLIWCFLGLGMVLDQD